MKDLGFYGFARSEPDKLALVDTQGRHWSRAELAGLANRTTRALRELGVSRADAIAIIAPNCAEFVAVYLAATQAGMYVVPINWHLSVSEIVHILSDSGAKAVVVHERVCRMVSRALETQPELKKIVIGSAPGLASLHELTQSQSPAAIEDPSMGRTMIYTSATTGRPKGVRLSLERAEATLRLNLELSAKGQSEIGVPPDAGQAHLCCSMLYHPAPLDLALFALHLGNPVVLMDVWRPDEMLKLVEKYRVRTTFMVPTMFVRLLKLPEEVRQRYVVSSLRCVSHGAAPCPVEVKRQMMEWWGPVLWEAYGASEGGVTLVTPEEWLRYPGTVGRALPGGAIRILDEEGRDLPAGSVGTIYVKTYTHDKFEYRHDSDKTRAAYLGDFFTVGDMGYLNEEGYLFICDRRIDMIISGGMNIYPAEIERALVLHPDVLDCAAFGVPDPILGESVRLAVQARPGVATGPELTSQLMRFMGASIATSKLPKRIEYVDSLPRDPSGKLFKRLLRDPYWVGHTRKV